MKRTLLLIVFALAALVTSAQNVPLYVNKVTGAIVGPVNASTFGSANTLGDGGSGDVSLSGNNDFTGNNSTTYALRLLHTNLAGGTALTVGKSYYDSLSAVRTLTFSGSPADGSHIEVLLSVTNAPTLTIPSCKRVGGSTTAITSLALTNGVHILSWTYANSTWWLTDSVPGLLDLTTGVTGVLPAANGGTGVANTGLISVAGNFSVSAGAFYSLTLNLTADTSVFLPTAYGAKLLSDIGTKADLMQGMLYAADAGSTDAYAISLTPAITAYATGAHYRFRANTLNTGASTLAIDGLTATAIKKWSAGALADTATGDIVALQQVEVVYNGTYFVMDSPVATPASGGGGSSPLTTKGDIYVYSTADARLPVGANGARLNADSTQTTGLKWVDPVFDTTTLELVDNFPGNATQLGWRQVTTGGAGIFSTYGNNRWSYAIRTNGGSGDEANIAIAGGGASDTLPFNGSKSWKLQYLIRFNDVTSIITCVGTASNQPTGGAWPDDGIYVRYDTASDSHFRLVARSNGTDTLGTDNLGTVADTTEYTILIWCVGDGVIHASVNGGTESTLSTGIPSDNSSPFMRISNHSAANKMLVCEKFALRMSGL